LACLPQLYSKKGKETNNSGSIHVQDTQKRVTDNPTAHQLHPICEVQMPILLNELQSSTIHGALSHALQNQFCFNKAVSEVDEQTIVLHH
jgi:hypothetical protein